MLGWNMTIQEYREYFMNSTSYRTYCRSLYPPAASRGGEARKMHTAMAFLLNGIHRDDEVHGKYLDEITRVQRKKDNSINDSLWKQAVAQYFGGSTSEAGRCLELFHLEPKNGETASALYSARANKTILLAYKELTDAVHESKVFSWPKQTSELKDFLDLLLTPPAAEQIIHQIRVGGSRQIILTGAPGTGKTYTAREIAKAACTGPNPWGASLKSDRTGKDEPYTLVQFHPSYDYTDFVEGLRPVMNRQAHNGSQIQFARMDGTFKAFCRKVVEANEVYLKQIKKEIGTLASTFNTMGPEEKTKSLSQISAYLYPCDAKKHLDAMYALTAIESSKTALSDLNMVVNRFPATQEDEKPWFDELNAAVKKVAELLPDDFPATADPRIADNVSEIQQLADTLKNIQMTNVNDVLPALQALLGNELLLAASSESADADKINLKEVFAAIQCLAKEPFKNKQAPTLSKAFCSNASDSNAFETILNFTRSTRDKDITQPATKKKWLNNLQTFMEALQIASPITERLRDAIQSLLDGNHTLETDSLFSELTAAIEKDSRILNPAAHKSCKQYFFIIDEINRANLSKVFGELMFCLEKDKRGTAHPSIQTQYHNLPVYDASSGAELKDDVFADGFYIPENVVIIGTMNDIDRSVDSMDFALRRRFEWKEIEVNEATLITAFLSGSYGKAIRDNAVPLTKCITALNDHILTKGSDFSLNRQYFISQGQFANLPADCKTTEQILEYVWEYRIESLLREYLRGESESDIAAFVGNGKDRQGEGAYAALFSKLETASNKTETKKSKGKSVSPQTPDVEADNNLEADGDEG